MKKIMFNDVFNLTEAVLSGEKTQTRRIITGVLPEIQEFRVVNNVCEYKNPYTKKWYKCNSKHQPKYKVGEVVAVAQNYNEVYSYYRRHDDNVCAVMNGRFGQYHAGWKNKMFVEALFMPYKIEITDVKVERLQDISEVDCIREGVFDLEPYGIRPKFTVNNFGEVFMTEKEAYAALIDRINGKGTWERNPYVFVYDFKIIK